MLRNLWVIKESGENLFQKNFGEENTLDENLISGLFLALTSFAKSSGAGDIDSINLEKAKFLYQHAGKIIVVIGIDIADEIEDVKDPLERVSQQFLKQYEEHLRDWDGNVARFRSFGPIVDAIFGIMKPPRFEEEKPVEKAEVKTVKEVKPVEKAEVKTVEEQKPAEKAEVKTVEEVKPVEKEPLIEEDMIKNEAQHLFMEYPTETIEDPFHYKIFISKSLKEHFMIEVNFKNYPDLPLIKFQPELRKMLGPPHEALLTICNWNRDNPPKIVEVFRELESYIMNYKPVS